MVPTSNHKHSIVMLRKMTVYKPAFSECVKSLSSWSFSRGRRSENGDLYRVEGVEGRGLARIARHSVKKSCRAVSGKTRHSGSLSILTIAKSELAKAIISANNAVRSVQFSKIEYRQS